MLCNLAKQIVVRKKDYNASNCSRGIERWALYIGELVYVSVILYMAGYVYSSCFSTKYRNRYHDSVALETGGMKHRGLENNPAWSFLNFQKHVSVVIQ